MMALIQRVKEASVEIDGKIAGAIGNGLLIFFGAKVGDVQEDVGYLANKCANLRIFCDAEDKMNLSLLDIKGEVLIVSQFTLYGDCRKGRRPGFDFAARPELAEPLYEDFIAQMKTFGLKVATGRFGADMLVRLQNDGPVTFIVEGKNA